MIAPSRRVRVSRIVQKRKILRLLPTMLVGSSWQQKGVFLLVVDFWHMKPECVGQEQRKVSSIWPEERRISKSIRRVYEVG